MSIDTRASLIKSAEYMLRSKGYAAFSYADLEKVVGIKKRVFITIFQKEDLGAVIIESYIQQSILDFERIEQDFPNAFGRLCAFASLLEQQCQMECCPYVVRLQLKWPHYQISYKC